MKNRRWGRRLLAAGIWAMAMLTWGSIGHHLLGFADFGPILTVTAVAAMLLWPSPAGDHQEIGAPQPTQAEPALPSRA